MPATVDALKAILADPKNLDNVKALTTPDVTYVSLNHSNASLKRIMPWCGTHSGPESIVETFTNVGRFWVVEKFEPDATFGDDKYAAMFGSFTYRSTVLGKRVTSPFATFAKFNAEGTCTYLQFMEDTLATADSFRKDGTWIMHPDPNSEEFELKTFN
jgi:hypothetical protein